MKNGFRFFMIIPRRNDPYLDRIPLLTFHEVVERKVVRVIEIWADGHTGVARSRDMLELGGAVVPDQLDPEGDTSQIANAPEIQISREQFEDYWQKALQRVHWELGVAISG